MVSVFRQWVTTERWHWKDGWGRGSLLQGDGMSPFHHYPLRFHPWFSISLERCLSVAFPRQISSCLLALFLDSPTLLLLEIIRHLMFMGYDFCCFYKKCHKRHVVKLHRYIVFFWVSLDWTQDFSRDMIPSRGLWGECLPAPCLCWTLLTLAGLQLLPSSLKQLGPPCLTLTFSAPHFHVLGSLLFIAFGST